MIATYETKDQRRTAMSTGKVVRWVTSRGVVELADGTQVPFTWDQVSYADERLRTRCESPVGDGRCVKVGDLVTYDPNNAQTPIRITAGA
jgi:hypothetical protein